MNTTDARPTKITLFIHRTVEIGGMVVYAIALLATLVVAAVAMYENYTIALFSLALLPIAWWVSDAFTGLLHWFFDTYGHESIPFFGPTVIQPFRMHHVDPEDMARHSLRNTLGNSGALAAPFQTAVFCVGLWAPPWLGATIAIPATIFGFGSLFANLFHRWAHEDAPPRPVRWLQKRGLIITEERHQRHHTRPFDSHYCITWGVADGFLERFRVFERAENLLAWLGLEISEDAHRERRASPTNRLALMPSGETIQR